MQDIETKLELDVKMIDLCNRNNYEMPIQTKNYGIIALQRFLFTWGVIVDINEIGYNRRYCYSSFEDAFKGYLLLLSFDEKENPPFDIPDTKWIKRKGEAGELSNPNNPKL